MHKKSLQIQQLNKKMSAFSNVKKTVPPSAGWIKAVRSAVGMSMQQLGKRLSITKQGVKEIENREQNGSITIKSLRETAKVLDMQLVYGFVPNDGSLEKWIDRKAKELASQIVSRTDNTMKLENQENNRRRIKKAIEEMTMTLKYEMPKNLWD